MPTGVDGDDTVLDNGIEGEEEIIDNPDMEQANDNSTGSSDIDVRLDVMEKQIGEASRRGDYWQKMYNDNQQSSAQVDEDPDEYLSRREIDDIVDRKLGVVKSTNNNSRMDDLERSAKEKYPDYKDVVGTYFADLVLDDPGLTEAVMMSKNPPLTAYRLGLTHPKFKKQSENETAKRVARDISTNLNKTQTLSGKGTGVKQDIDYSINGTSEEDFEKMIERAKDPTIK